MSTTFLVKYEKVSIYEFLLIKNSIFRLVFLPFYILNLKNVRKYGCYKKEKKDWMHIASVKPAIF